MPKQLKMLARGVPLLSKSKRYKKSGKWAVKTRGPVAGQVKKTRGVTRTKVTKQFGKKGDSRVVVRPRTPRFYPTERTPKKHYVRPARPPKTRPSLVPGVVLIVLAGPNMGRRVVLLKVLPSGLLLITGPYKINGVPLRRVNPRYVIATSTKIDIEGINIPDTVNDDFFKKPRKSAPKKSQEEFFEGEKKDKEKKEVSPERKELQKSVDDQLLPIIAKTRYLKDYLHSHFTLTKGEYPHLLKF